MLSQKRPLILSVLSLIILVSLLYGYNYFIYWMKYHSTIGPIGFREAFILHNIIPVIFGAILGLLQLFRNSPVIFSVDWSNLIIQGIPAFLIGSPYFFFFILQKSPLFISSYDNVTTLAGTWLGYVIITSLFKNV